MKKAMTTAAIALCTMLTFALASCTPEPADLIVGTWNTESFTGTSSGYPDEEDNGTITGLDEGESLTITFRDDNSGTMSATIPDEETGRPYNTAQSFTYTLSGSSLTITYGVWGETDTIHLTVDKLDKHHLTLTATTTETYRDDDGTSHTVTDVVTLQLRRA